MKLKASEIVLVIAAVGVLALLGYNLLKMGGEEAVENKSAQPVSAEKVQKADAKTLEEITRLETLEREFDLPPEELRKLLMTAPREQVLRFMRLQLERDLPDGYEFPEFLLTAGSSKESVKRIGERYPEFFEKGGQALVKAVREYPVKYEAMIQESRAYRQLYRPTSEIEAEEQAAAAHKMREELKRKKEAEEGGAE